MKVNSILLILCLIMVFGFTACSGDAGTVQTADVSVIDTETEAETTTSGPTLDLPQANNNGKTFSILTTVHAAYEYDAEEHSGDVVEDAVYMRNTAVEELLGINFNFIYQPGHWADRAAFNTSIKTSVMAGDGAYDLVNAVILCVLPTAVEGLFIDVNELDWVDLDKPWWVQNMYDDLAVGKLADLVVIDMKSPNMHPVNNIARNIVYSGSKSNVRMTMVNGVVRYEKGEYFIGEDTQELYKRVKEHVSRIIR